LEWTHLSQYFTEDKVVMMLAKYKALGPLFGIGLPYIESFLAGLPLFAFVIANANAFGLWLGFLFSWIGTSLGALSVFLLFRKLTQFKFVQRITKYKRLQQGMTWLNQHSFGTLFLLSCFPFTPSSLLNIVAGLSRMPSSRFLPPVMLGKAVMVFMMSLLGHNFISVYQKPWKLILFLGIIFLMWFAGKKVEARLHRKK
jgi:uncharacterized membrane protein YdjX (TVP38/TMEM64 family)